MKLLKWLTHPVYLLLIIIAVAIYLNGDVLFGEQAAAPAPAGSLAAGPAAQAGQQPAVITAPAPVQSAGLHPAPPVAEAVSGAVGEGAERTPAKEPPAAVAEASGEAPDDSEAEWSQARLLAWQGDWDAAIDAYRGLAERQPDNIDVHGELGNVLMRAGRWEAAADAYAAAGRAAARADDEPLAWYLHGIIAGLDYEKAADLRRALTAAREPAAANDANGG